MKTIFSKIILLSSILILVLSLNGCGLITGMIFQDDPNKYYKPDTTLITQTDSVYPDLDYDNLYGYDESAEMKIDSSEIKKMKNNIDSLKTILNSVIGEKNKILFDFDIEKNIKENNILSIQSKMYKLKNIIDSLEQNTTDSTLLKQLNDAKLYIAKNDSAMVNAMKKNKNMIGSIGDEKNTLIMGMCLIAISFIILFVYSIFNKKKS